MLVGYLVILVASYLITALIFPFLNQMIKDSNLVKPNYRGENIPVAGGLVFLVLLPIIAGTGMLVLPSYKTVNVFLFHSFSVGLG